MPRSIRALVTFAKERWDSPTALRWLGLSFTGATSTACLLTAWLQSAFLLGTTLPVVAGASLSLLIGACLGLSTLSLRLWKRFPASLTFAVAETSLALYALLLPSLLSGLNRIIAAGLFLPDQPIANAFIACLLTLPLIAIPAFVLCGLLQGLLRECVTFSSMPAPRRSVSAALMFATGAVSGILAAVVLAGYQGLRPASIASAIISLGLALWLTWRWSQRKEQNVAFAIGSETVGPTSSAFAWAKLLAATLLGSALAGGERILEQLSPVSAYTVAAEALGLALGCCCGLFTLEWCLRRHGRADVLRRNLVLIAAVVAAIVPATFPLMVQAALSINTSLTNVWLSLACRAGLMAVLACPIASAWIQCAIRLRHSDGDQLSAQEGEAVSLSWSAVGAFGAGWLLSELFMLPIANPSVILAIAATILCVIVIGEQFLAKQLPATLLTRFAVGCAAALIVTGTCLIGQYNPATSAKVLFSTNTFLAWRSGLPDEQLLHLDQGRCESSRLTDRGVLTLWNYGGYQFQLRDSGIPKGIISTDAQLFPQFSPEILQSAAPLVLHDKPQRVLVLGVGSGVAVTTALQFPVQKVVALEGEQGLLSLMKEKVFPACQPNPVDDDRLSFGLVEPAVGVSSAGTFDVIISVADQAALVKSQAMLTEDFYRRAAKCLPQDGIFCQRFQFIDAGPDAIRQVARTLQTAFTHVTALEVSAGELICLGTNDPRGLVRKGLLERLQAEHVRQTFGQMGLDWSVMLNLPAFGQDALTEFVSSTTRPNCAASGEFAFGMPREVLRWADKLQEVQVATAQQVGRLEDWLDAKESNSRELVRRLSEVTAQQELLTKHSDQFWAYRASLRDQVQNHPRSLIEQVAASDEPKRLHPEDRRRIQYFDALRQAIETHSLADIQKLLAFQSPYDPLISFFVQQEAAELLANSKTAEPATEFRLRLHAIYFTSPQDGSLRNVLRALKLLRENPGIEPNPLRRWDHFNSLLQMLQGRWQARIGIPPTQSTKMVLGEINTSILETEKTFETLGSLSVQAKLPAETWPLRRRVLEVRLLRPLQEYHAAVFNHYQQMLSKRQAESETLDAVAPDVEAITP